MAESILVVLVTSLINEDNKTSRYIIQVVQKKPPLFIRRLFLLNIIFSGNFFIWGSKDVEISL